MKNFNLKDKSIQIRRDIVEIFSHSGRGHLPSAFSLVEILCTLYYQAADLKNDKILLSKGHGCLALYAILADLGYYDKSEWKKFCRPGGILGGHPTRVKVPGVEISAGSLGHGPSIAVGMALATKSKIFCIIGDGESNEGSVWEAALSANKNQTKNLTLITDYNKMQSYGKVSDVMPLEPLTSKWEAFGFEVYNINMETEPEKMIRIVSLEQHRPRMIICHTIKGQGSKILENDLSWHHKNGVSENEILELRQSIY